MNTSVYISELIEKDTRDEQKMYWNKFGVQIKHNIIYNVFINKNVEVAELLIDFFLEDFIVYPMSIHYNYVNLLAVVLASTHLPKYLKYIVRAKMIDDLFFYIDSNLLFEFSGGSRETSIIDTLDKINELCDELPTDLAAQYKKWIHTYSVTMNDWLVMDQWLKYKTPEYRLWIEDLGIVD